MARPVRLPYPRTPRRGGVGPSKGQLDAANKRFYRDLDRWKVEFPRLVDDAIRFFVLEVSQTIVIGGPFGNPTGTPVDTSKARNNWYITVNGSGTNPNVSYDEARGDSSRGEDNLIDVMWSTVMRAPKGAQFQLRNKVPYLWKLEYGWSRQAPSGMVRVTRMNSREIFRYVIATFVQPVS